MDFVSQCVKDGINGLVLPRKFTADSSYIYNSTLVGVDLPIELLRAGNDKHIPYMVDESGQYIKLPKVKITGNRILWNPLAFGLINTVIGNTHSTLGIVCDRQVTEDECILEDVKDKVVVLNGKFSKSELYLAKKIYITEPGGGMESFKLKEYEIS